MSGRAVFLWVVIPFVVLSVLALWFTRSPLTPALPPPPTVEAPRDPPPPPPSPPPTRAAPLPTRPTPPPRPAEEPLPEPPPGTWARETVHEALRAVQPRVRQCLDDAELRHTGGQSVTLRLTLQADGERGTFQGLRVEESSFQDPFVFACIEDAFAETQFSAPPGPPPLTLSWPVHSRTWKKGTP